MTSVAINKSGTDQTVLLLNQTGNSETSVNLRHNLLDDRLNYMFAVDSLSVPLNNAPISNVKVATELFRIRRRNVGALYTDPTDVYFDQGRFVISPDDKHYDVSAFARALSNWARGFNEEQSKAGIEDLRPYGGPADAGTPEDAVVGVLEVLPQLTVQQAQTQPYNFISVQVTPDGKVQFTGTANFWNNFVFKFSDDGYGAALLGMSTTVDADGYVGYSNPPTGAVNQFYDEYGVITAPEWQQAVHMVGDHPLWQSADQRIRISVDSHLPMAANLTVVDQKETVNREIAEAFFESHLETAVRFDNAGRFADMTMKSKLYSGQVSFIKKSSPHPEWHKLLTSFELRFFRFHLNIWYRTWNGSGWTLTKSALEVPENKYWSMSIRFVSES